MRDIIFQLGTHGLGGDDGIADPSRKKEPPDVRCAKCDGWLRKANRHRPYLCDACRRKLRDDEEAEYLAALDVWRVDALKSKHPLPMPRAPATELVRVPVRRIQHRRDGT